MKIASCMTMAAVAVIATVFLAACDMLSAKPAANIDATGFTEIELTRAEVLALAHLVQNHETPEEGLKGQVAAFLHNTASAARSVVGDMSTVTGSRKFTKTYQDGFVGGTADRRSAAAGWEASEIPFYVFDLENPVQETNGFALTCGDDRVGNILAVVEDGEYEEEGNDFFALYNELLNLHIEKTIKQYNSVTEADIAAALEKQNRIERSTARYAGGTSAYSGYHATPLLVTRWHQGYPYNILINTEHGVPLSQIQEPDPTVPVLSYKTGSVAIAIAQIMAYHGKPLRPMQQLYDQDVQNKTGFTNPFSPYQTIPFWSIGANQNGYYDWVAPSGDSFLTGITGYPNADALDPEIKRQIGVLLYQICRNLNIVYGSLSETHSSGGVTSLGGALVPVDPTNIGLTLGEMGYAFSTKDYFTNEPDSRFKIEQSLTGTNAFKGPVLMYGCRMFTSNPYSVMGAQILTQTGYGWVVDNFYKNTVSGIFLLHCNVGRGGNGNGWYEPSVFDVDGRYVHQYHVKMWWNITPQ